MTRDGLPPDANFHEIRSYLGVEAVAIHAEIARSIPEADESRRDTTVLFYQGLYCFECLPGVDHSACVSRK